MTSDTKLNECKIPHLKRVGVIGKKEIRFFPCGCLEKWVIPN